MVGDFLLDFHGRQGDCCPGDVELEDLGSVPVCDRGIGDDGHRFSFDQFYVGNFLRSDPLTDHRVAAQR